MSQDVTLKGQNTQLPSPCSQSLCAFLCNGQIPGCLLTLLYILKALCELSAGKNTTICTQYNESIQHRTVFDTQ